MLGLTSFGLVLVILNRNNNIHNKRKDKIVYLFLSQSLQLLPGSEDGLNCSDGCQGSEELFVTTDLPGLFRAINSLTLVSEFQTIPFSLEAQMMISFSWSVMSTILEAQSKLQLFSLKIF